MIGSTSTGYQGSTKKMAKAKRRGDKGRVIGASGKSSPVVAPGGGRAPAMGKEMIDRNDGKGMQKSLPFGGGKRQMSSAPPKSRKKASKKK